MAYSDGKTAVFRYNKRDVIEGAVGGAFGFGGSVLNQIMSGEKINWRKAANGAVVGAVRRAMVIQAQESRWPLQRIWRQARWGASWNRSLVPER